MPRKHVSVKSVCNLTVCSFAVRARTNGVTTSVPTVTAGSGAWKIDTVSLRRLRHREGWLDGVGIDAFMAWAIHKDICYFEGVRDDYTAAHDFSAALCCSILPVGTASTIYFPTHLQVQFHSPKGLESLTTSPRCMQECYKEACLNMEEGLMMYNIGNLHWTLLSTCHRHL